MLSIYYLSILKLELESSPSSSLKSQILFISQQHRVPELPTILSNGPFLKKKQSTKAFQNKTQHTLIHAFFLITTKAFIKKKAVGLFTLSQLKLEDHSCLNR